MTGTRSKTLFGMVAAGSLVVGLGAVYRHRLYTDARPLPTTLASAALPAMTILTARGPVDLTDLDVHYFRWPHDRCAPGYYDFKARTFYRWRGLVMPQRDVAHQDDQFSGVRVRDALWLDITAIDVDPLVTYVDAGGGGLAPGYYDNSSNTLYRWRGVVVRAEDVPEGERARAGIKFTPTGEFRTVWIDPPAKGLGR